MEGTEGCKTPPPAMSISTIDEQWDPVYVEDPIKSSVRFNTVVPTPDEKARIYMKRFAFSRTGQFAYLFFIGFMMVTSVILVMVSLVNMDHHVGGNVYQPVMWIQILEGFVDFTFIVEVSYRAMSTPAFWRSPMSYIDLLIIVACVVTDVLFNWYPSTVDNEDEETASVIYISRQIIRFTRCVYFFSWFSGSFVEFKKETLRRNSFGAAPSPRPSSSMPTPILTSFPGQGTPTPLASTPILTSYPGQGSPSPLTIDVRSSSPYDIIDEYTSPPSPTWNLEGSPQPSQQPPTFTYAVI